MARVPLVEGPQVRTQALPGVRQQIATPQDAFGGVQAERLQQLGDMGQKLALHYRDEADQSRIDDALNQLRERELDYTYGEQDGYTRLKGVDALQRPSKKALSDEYTERYGLSIDEIEQSLGNDRQRALFRQRASERMTQFRGNLMNYEAQENQSYQLSVAEGTINTATREIAAFYNDPGKINEGVASIRAAAFKDGRLRGLAAEQVEARANKLVSGAHLAAIDQALATNNPLYAEQYLRTYKDQMDPGDLLKARAQVDEVASVYIGNAKASQVLAQFTRADEPSDMDRFMNLTGEVDIARLTDVTVQAESGGRRYGDDGQLLESPAGAKGEMQVMDATNRDPGFGVRPAQDDSPEERARVGRDYLQALVKRYDGNLAYTWAAYNAGPGRFEAAMKAAAEEGNPSAWLDKMPAETQTYVVKNLKAYQEGAGRPPVPNIAELHAQLANDPDLRSRPAALKKAQEQLDRQHALYLKGKTEVQSNAYAEAMRHIENGGRYDDIPKQIRDKINPNKWASLRKYEETVLGGGKQVSDLAVYQLLSGDPDRVRGMSDSEFYALRGDLSESDFKKFADMRGKPGATDKANPGALDLPMVNNVVDGRLRAMGLDPKAKSLSAGARVGAIRKTINDEVLLRQQAAGRKFDDAEITKVVDELFLKTRSFRDRSWLEAFRGEAGEVRKATLFGATVRDIPKEQRTALEADFKAMGVEEPTDQQMLEAFFMGELRR